MASSYDIADNIFKDAARRNASRRFLPRFWQQKGSQAEIVFLDDLPRDKENNKQIVLEHVVQEYVNGKARYRNVVSPKTYGEHDPLADAGSYARPTVYYSIVDLTSVYEGKDWKFRFQKKLLPLSQTAYEALKLARARLVKAAEKAGDVKRAKAPLKYAKFTIARTNAAKSPQTGEVFNFEEYVDPQELLAAVKKGLPRDKREGVTLDPFDYAEILACPDEDELESMARSYLRRQKEASDEADDDAEYSFSKKSGKSKVKPTVSDDDEDDDDVSAESLFDEDADDDGIDEDTPKRPVKAGKKTKPAPVEDEDDEEDFEDEDEVDESDDEEIEADEDEEDEPPVRKKPIKKAPAKKPTKPAKAPKKKVVEDDEEDFEDTDDEFSDDE